MADPTPSRDAAPALTRRTFVGLSAASAAAGGVGSALAVNVSPAQPQAPLVPEEDPSLAITRPQIARPGRTLDSYHASPKYAGPSTPGVVVVHHVWGVDTNMRDIARRLAKQGYSALIPDLYSGMNAPAGDGLTDIALFRPYAQRLVDATVDDDLAAAAASLRSEAGNASLKVGVLGFCGGGAIALRQTVDNVSAFRAAVVFYGKVRYSIDCNNDRGPITPIEVAYAAALGVPLLGNYGARDQSIPADDVRELDRRLTELRKPHDIKIYADAGHAFFDDTRASYVGDAAADAWVRTLGWFGKHLF